MVSEDLCEDRPTQGGTGQWTRAERARWVCGRSAQGERALMIEEYIWRYINILIYIGWFLLRPLPLIF